jgi:hypothetical protein
MATNVTIALGPDPYRHDEHGGNGTWMSKGTDPELVLESLLAMIPFAGEAVGRHEGWFFPGVSLEGVPEEEVIQVWSSSRDCVERSLKLKREGRMFGDRVGLPHVGDGVNLGLWKELRVQDVREYAERSRNRFLLPNGQASPVGLVLRSEQPLDTIRKCQNSLVRQERELRASQEAMRDAMRKMKDMLELGQAYFNASSGVEVLQTGRKAGVGVKWTVFQARLYLDEEIGLLANLVDMTWRDLASMDRWLLAEDRWKRLLPTEKCLLVTRVRREKKNYGDWIVDMVENGLNMQHYLWVRNGENVFRVGMDIALPELMFPGKDLAQRVFQRTCERIHEERYRRWGGERPKRYGLKEKAVDEAEPYALEYRTDAVPLDAWLESEELKGMEEDIWEGVNAALWERNRKRMPFFIFLQGLVDRTALLDVPPGTSLLEWSSVHRYFDLVVEYEQGLPDLEPLEAIEKARALVKRGDWVLGVAPPDERCKRFDEVRRWALVRVCRREEEGLGIHFFPFKRTRTWDPMLRKAPEEKILAWKDVFPLSYPTALIPRLLTNRNWKQDHRELVPFLAQWKQVLAASHKTEVPQWIRLKTD